MIKAERRASKSYGIEAVLLENKSLITSFLRARGAGDGADDLFQELWLKISRSNCGPVANPLSYLYRAANNLMLDQYRSARQSELREQAWGEAQEVTEPSVESILISRQHIAEVERAIEALGPRPSHIFHRFRIDGIKQRDIAFEMGLSLSTVEAEIRKVYAALLVLKGRIDE